MAAATHCDPSSCASNAPSPQLGSAHRLPPQLGRPPCRRTWWRGGEEVEEVEAVAEAEAEVQEVEEAEEVQEEELGMC